MLLQWFLCGRGGARPSETIGRRPVRRGRGVWRTCEPEPSNGRASLEDPTLGSQMAALPHQTPSPVTLVVAANEPPLALL